MKTKIRRIAISPWCWITGSAAMLLFHVVWAIVRHDPMAVSRCGATWVVFAGAIVARPIIRLGYRKWYESTRKFDGGEFEASPNEIESDKQSELDARSVQILGPLLAVSGTLLWAYGDLLMVGSPT